MPFGFTTLILKNNREKEKDLVVTGVLRGPVSTQFPVATGLRAGRPSPRTRSGVWMVARESGQFLDSCLRRNDE